MRNSSKHLKAKKEGVVWDRQKDEKLIHSKLAIESEMWNELWIFWLLVCHLTVLILNEILLVFYNVYSTDFMLFILN